MPAKARIRQHWAQYLVDIGRFDSLTEVFDGDYCFACGFDNGFTYRCHIQAFVKGGTHECQNLHLLCFACHRASEFLEGKRYFEWFLNRNIIDVLGQEYLNTGGSLQQLMAFHLRTYK